MKLSIIVPVYNIEKYILECVDSLLNQDYDDYEIILVDDGSTDHSGNICDILKGKNNKIKVIHKKNGGLADARNTGIKNAIGKYIIFVDGDDYIEKNILKVIINSCENQDNPEVMFLRANKIFPSGRTEELDQPYDINAIRNKNTDEVLKYIANLNKYPTSACTKMISRELIIKEALYFEFGKLSEDMDWTKRLLTKSVSFGYCNEIYYYYRQFRKESISNSLSYRNFIDISNTIDSWLIEAKTKNTEFLYSISCYEYKVLLYVYNFVSEKSEKQKAKKWLKDHKWILTYRNDRQIQMIRICINFFGLVPVTQLIKMYLNIRGK